MEPTDHERRELLPCPFCGGKPLTLRWQDADLWAVSIVFQWTADAEPDAIDQWNARETPAAAEPVAYMLDGSFFTPSEIGWRKDGAALIPLYTTPPDARLRALEEAAKACEMAEHLPFNPTPSDYAKAIRALAWGGEHGD